MFFGIAEMPKNMINTSNEVNVLLGVTGGVLKGTLHTMGRLLAGATDFLTFPVPSQPITHPAFVWQDFRADTTYGPFFDTSRNPGSAKPPMAPSPAPSAASRPARY
jgi:putative exosortase-associated protein (TIGR04073 family)